MPNLHTPRFRLTSDGRLEVYDYRLASILNKELRRYDNGDYRFKPGEEALYLLRQIELDGILSRFLAPKSKRQRGVATTLQTPGGDR